MTSSREFILNKLDKTLNNKGLTKKDRQDAVARRLEVLSSGPRPAHAVPVVGGAVTRADIFAERAERAGAFVYRVCDGGRIPLALKEALARYAIENKEFPEPGAIPIRRDGDPRLKDIDWKSADMTVRAGAVRKTDRIAVSYAFAGVAETGTVVLLSGAKRSTRLNFLPEVHGVIVEKSTILSHYEDIWMLLRKESSQHPILPRTINLITGPSRTADIEQTLLMGAHGPRCLIVLIVDG